MKSYLSPLLLFFGAFLVSWIYQTSPSLGDDINYWGLAFDLHHHVENAWDKTSFHDLRWPVWGLCWLLQIPFGFSALSYYLEPMVYLGAGAVIVYLLAREIGTTERLSLIAGVLFLFHPQLDSVIDRPMPDLSEGFWSAAALLAWLKMIHGNHRGAKVAFAATVGLTLAVGQANRITGVFVIPILFLSTVIFYPRQIFWLLLCGLFTSGFIFIEAAIYHSITGNWLHSIEANLGARGRKGTESIPIWNLPFRFLSPLFRRYTDIIFNSLAAFGIILACIRYGRGGRVLALYAVGYLFIYSCALQSFFPPRPLVRDGERFLGSLAFPLSILTALTLEWLMVRLPSQLKSKCPVVWLQNHSVVTSIALIGLLMLLSSRSFRGVNYLYEIGDYIRLAPAGLRVLSHNTMRHVASLADPYAAARIQWNLKKDLLDPSPTTLKLAADSDEIWFNRKWIWTGSRKKSEYDQLDVIGNIAPYLRPPLTGWTARRAILKGDVPDFVFLGRDNLGITEQGPDGKLLRTSLLPEFSVPYTWDFKNFANKTIEFPVQSLPLGLVGHTLFLSLRYSSNTTEPIRAGVTFFHKDTPFLTMTFKPYFFDKSSEDFFFVTIPTDADAMRIRLRISEKTKRISLDRFQLFIDQAPRSY